MHQLLWLSIRCELMMLLMVNMVMRLMIANAMFQMLLTLIMQTVKKK